MKKIIFIMTAVIVAACSKPKPVADDSPMLMNAMTKSPADFGTDRPVFLFWLDSDFSSIAEGVYTQPYLEAWPNEDIDAYRPEIKTYDTGKRYPDNDQEVYCTGYFPGSLIVGNGNRPLNWARLTVPTEDIGKADVLVAPEHITGKSSQHFETKNPEEPLVFVHAQSKISFKAKMGTEMAQNRYLRNIQVTVPGTGLMSGLKWENGRYIADRKAGEEISFTLKDPNTTQLDPSQQARDLGHVLVYPGMTGIRITAEVEMSDSPLFDKSKRISIDTYIDFMPTDGNGNILRENEAYEIVLVIDYDSIALKGRKAEWEEGGGLLIPIYPDRQ